MDETTNKGSLPPLPPSDEVAMAKNQYDGLYKTKSRDFWGQNRVVRENLKDFDDCNHYFEKREASVECKKCHMGLIGNFEIQNGKLFLRGEQVGI